MRIDASRVPRRVWGRAATELAAGLRAREFSAREVMESHLERIAAVNPRVNAIVTLLDPELALAAADAKDRIPPTGPLHGLPIAVKDLEDTAGMRTTYGSELFADHVPAEDSLVVERLRAAGAIVIGKTNTPEFGAGSQTFNPVFGATRNPYDLTRTPGGSSGGAAAAVAAGMLPFADGSDLGASVRNPAAFCNLVGLRPSPGRIPQAGPGDPWNPFAVLGPIARNPRDAALLLGALSGPDPRDPLSIAEPFPVAGLDSDPSGLRIAWSRDLGGLPVEPEITAVLEGARTTLTDLGCVVEDAEPEFAGADEAFEVHRGVAFAGAFAAIIEDVKPTLAANTRYGLRLSGPQIARAQRLRGELFTRMREFLNRYDALAAPVTQVAPFDVELEYPGEIAGVPMSSYIEWFRSCSRITVTTHPAIAVPAGFTPGGLPVGLQIVGRYRGELALLRLAHAFTQATRLEQRVPAL
jgi:amidase